MDRARELQQGGVDVGGDIGRHQHLPALGLALVATPLAAVMVGDEFRAATTHIVPWVAVAGLLNGIMSHYTAHAFLITQHTRLLMLTTGLAALANVLLNLLLMR